MVKPFFLQRAHLFLHHPQLHELLKDGSFYEETKTNLQYLDALYEKNTIKVAIPQHTAINDSQKPINQKKYSL